MILYRPISKTRTYDYHPRIVSALTILGHTNPYIHLHLTRTDLSDEREFEAIGVFIFENYNMLIK